MNKTQNSSESGFEKLPAQKKHSVLNLWNDGYARVFLEGNTPVIADMINAALEKENIQLAGMEAQKQKSNRIFNGLATDQKGHLYTVELLSRDQEGFEEWLGDGVPLLIKMTLKSGPRDTDCPERILIAFSESKPEGVSKDLAIYKIGWSNLETGEIVWDHEKTLMINGSHIPDLDTPIGKVIHDMREESPENMLLDSFKETAYALQETKEGAGKLEEIQQLTDAQDKA